ncbi:MAG: endonuclease [Planctomycetota bacterium]
MITPLALVAAALAADPYAPPAGYYDSVSGTGAALEASLHQRVSFPFTSWSYSVAAVALQAIDEDPNDPDRIVLIYNGQSVPAQWDSGATWNREHTWPRSRGIDSSGPDNSDFHMLRPCNPGINSSRSNKPFGGGGSYWDPGSFGEYDRGEIARSMFYAAVRYDGQESGTTDLQLVPGFPSGNQMGDLDALLVWHYAEAPDTRERRRNYYVFSDEVALWAQGNRNPFIDRPEYAWALWGTGPNDSRVTLQGGNPQSDGASELMVDLGDAVVGSDPAGTTVTITKTGIDPTSYTVTLPEGIGGELIGFFDGSVAGPRTFPSGSQQAQLAISFGSTDAVGLIDGVVTVDNTDLTTAGAGRGSADANDDVIVLGRVVAPADARLDGQTSVSVSAGSIAPGETSAALASLAALEPEAGLTAAAEVLSISGATTSLALDLQPGDVIDAGNALDVRVTAPMSAPLGAASATFQIELGDEQTVAGAASRRTLTLSVSAVIAPSCVPDVTSTGSNPGDSSYGVSDGTVDTADLSYYVEQWVAQNPITDVTSTTSNPGDPGYGVPDGVVGIADLSYFVEQWIAGCP